MLYPNPATCTCTWMLTQLYCVPHTVNVYYCICTCTWRHSGGLSCRYGFFSISFCSQYFFLLIKYAILSGVSFWMISIGIPSDCQVTPSCFDLSCLHVYTYMYMYSVYVHSISRLPYSTELQHLWIVYHLHFSTYNVYWLLLLYARLLACSGSPNNAQHSLSLKVHASSTWNSTDRYMYTQFLEISQGMISGYSCQCWMVDSCVYIVKRNTLWNVSWLTLPALQWTTATFLGCVLRYESMSSQNGLMSSNGGALWSSNG